MTVSILLDNLAENTGRITTIGHVFSEGQFDATAGITATVAGNAIPLQVDVKATWPDGSIKHAVLSIENPESGPDGTASLTLTAGSGASTALPSASLADLAAAQDYSFEVEIDGEVVELADLLSGASSPWLSGPLTQQSRVETTFENGLSLRADVTVKADGTIDTSVVIGNDNIDTTTLTPVTYAYALRQNGVEVLSNDSLTQPHFTVWRESFSTADTPNTAHAIYDIAAMRATGLLPMVDETLTLNDADEYALRLNDPNATFDPLELGGIDNIGGIDQDRGRTGTSPSYGVLTDDQHSYLVTQDADARAAMLALTDQYGAFSNYYRNPETGEAYFLEDADFNSFHTGVQKDVAGTGGVVDLTNDGLAGQNSASHKPSEYYLSYLVTGDRYYADGLAHEAGSARALWANGAFLTERGAVDFGAQLREQAWGLRDLFYAASLAPDGSHAASVLSARLDGALQDYLDYYVNGETLNSQLGRPLTGIRAEAPFQDGDITGVLRSFNGTAIDRVYWQDWFGMVVGQIAATGNDAALELANWMTGFSAERFLQDDFDARSALYSVYGNGSGTSLSLDADTTWADLQAISEAGGNDDTLSGFFAASAWGGTAALLNGTGDVRYAEALVTISSWLNDALIDSIFTDGDTAQFSIPVAFADGTVAGIGARLQGTDANDTVTVSDGPVILHAGGGNDRIETGNGNALVDGGDGNDRLIGGAGQDWLFGGSGADRISGGGGLNIVQGDRHDADFGAFADVFSFENDTLGDTRIVDFDIIRDQLAFDGFRAIRTAEDALALFEDRDAGAFLDLGAGGRLTLDGVSVSQLTAGHFLLENVVNTAPIAANDTLEAVVAGHGMQVAIADLLSNDHDPDEDSFSLTGVTGAYGGAARYDAATGIVTFDAAADFTGTARFTYTIRDAFGAEASATASLDVLPPPVTAPSAPEIDTTITGPGSLRGTLLNDEITPTGINVWSYGRIGDDVFHLHHWAASANGGNGDDVFYLHATSHSVWGGAGADDFVLAGPRIGVHIRDFNASHDTLFFADGIGGITDQASFDAALVQKGKDALVRTTEGTVHLRNVDISDLTGPAVAFYQTPAEPPRAIDAPLTTNTISGPGWLNGTDDNDLITSGGSNLRLSGAAGDDHIISAHWAVRVEGGAGDDFIELRAHDGVLYGGSGDDVFLFTERLDGTIRDFQSGGDRIALTDDRFGYSTAEEAYAAIEDTDKGAILRGDNTDTLLIAGRHKDDLSIDDFAVL